MPKVLLFEINRLTIDFNGNTIKVKKPFSFPKILNPGRFLSKNKKISMKLQKSMTEKKIRVKQLENSIEKFDKFNGTNLKLGNMLSLCSDFLHSQKNPELSIEESDIQVFTPSSLMCQENLEEATSLIDSYSSKVNEIVNQIKEELVTCNQEIENTFDREELKEHEYLLTGIIVHDGEVGSGQYYVYMQNSGGWKKYHDVNVTEVNEKAVMFDALGEYGISAACCLVYTSQKLIDSS